MWFAILCALIVISTHEISLRLPVFFWFFFFFLYFDWVTLELGIVQKPNRAELPSWNKMIERFYGSASVLGLTLPIGLQTCNYNNKNKLRGLFQCVLSTTSAQHVEPASATAGREWNREKDWERDWSEREWGRTANGEKQLSDRQSECAAYWNVGHKVLWLTDDETETSLNVRYMPEFLAFRTIFFWFILVFFLFFIFVFCLFCKSVFLLGLANTKTCFLVSGAGARAQRRLRLAQNLSSRFCVCVFLPA